MKTKKMFKAVQAVTLALLMAVLSVATMFTANTSVVYAESELIMKVHYHRDDGDYSEFSSVWLWAEGHDGADYAFAEEDGEMVATMEVEAGTTSVGFIVRTEDWGKDIDSDQYIDIAEMVSGTVHIYIESGVEGYTKEYGDDAVVGTKLKSAIYDGEGTVSVQMTGDIEGDYTTAFTFASSSDEIEITSVTASDDYVYLITLAEELVDTRSYYITFEEVTYSVNMPNIYSTEEFEELYTYEGDDLGATWSAESTTFRVWAPTADEAYVNLYESGTSSKSDLIETIAMTADVQGTWVVTVDGDLNGVYYTYTVVIDGTKSTAVDPYARTTGVNGERGMVIDLDSTDPEGWEDDTNPHAGESITDAVIYELQLRDLSADESSGIENVGKYLSLTETGTTTEGGISTGLDYLVDLGITHLHLMPVYDFGSVNETYTTSGLYNWGYDPVNYNVPEGSYSTDPYNGEVRVTEFKEMVMALHENNISVVMDVVYNHVYSADDFCFNKLVPGYFSRINDDGTYSSGSGCGNDTATERSMVRKYIVDSILYWVEEYHIDGFRFDLVGLMDTETINEIVEEVHAIYPDVIFYGEGWTLSTDVTKDDVELATQTNSELTPDFAYFNDTIRDALKGSVFDDEATGYVSGASGLASTIASCFQAIVDWSTNPSQIINYSCCHDNMTLFDRLQNSRTDASFSDLVKMNNLSAAIVLTSEGVPFLMSGEEMLRSKTNSDGTYNTNSYNAGDDVNALQWSNLEDEEYQQVYQYYKGLIAFRKAHSALRLSTADEVATYVTEVTGLDENVIAFDISGDVEGEDADEIFVIYNSNETATTVELPEGDWNVYVNADAAGTEVLGTASGSVEVEAVSAMVLCRDSAKAAVSASADGTTTAASKAVGVAAIILLLAFAVGCVLASKKKQN